MGDSESIAGSRGAECGAHTGMAAIGNAVGVVSDRDRTAEDVVKNGSEASVVQTRSAKAMGVFYVDANLGNDAYTGLSRTVAGGHGPKRTIGAAMIAAGQGDTVYVAGGEYRESVRNNKVRLIATGRVVARGS